MEKLRAPLTLTIALWFLSASAAAQVEEQLQELNAQALEAYQNLDIETAGTKLEEALALAEQNGYSGPEVATTYMNLGVIYVTGVGDPDQALSNFIQALCLQNDVQLDPLLSTPDVQMVFEQAVSDAQSGACGGAAPAANPTYQDLMPQQVPASSGPRIVDEECPPGIKCGGGDDDDDEPAATDWARFFFGVGISWGNALVQSGMEADSRPPLSEVIDGNGTDMSEPPDGLPDLADLDGDGELTAADYLPLEFAPQYGISLDTDGDGVPDLNTIDFDGDGAPDNRYFFDDKSAWVPDADSFDDFEVINPDSGVVEIPRAVTPVSTKCAADGTETGPLDLGFTDIAPSKYCVRVERVGFVSNLALRLNPGYFVSSGFALSVPLRIQFDAGEGTLSNMLVGLRGEVLFSSPNEATGVPVSWFFGATFGQIQAKPPPADPGRAGPYVISGPAGAHTGLNVRVRVHRNFGFVIAPELDVQFPDFLLNIDATAGIEAAF